MIDTLFTELKSHLNNTIVKHFAYDEKTPENEEQEMAYLTPAVFITLKEQGKDGLFSFVKFDLRVELKTLERTDSTLTQLYDIKSLVRSFRTTGENACIEIDLVKPSQKAGNAPIHTLQCSLYKRL